MKAAKHEVGSFVTQELGSKIAKNLNKSSLNDVHDDERRRVKLIFFVEMSR